MAKLLLATHNENKMNEFCQIFSEKIDAFNLKDLISSKNINMQKPVEDAMNFAGNALIKARTLSKKIKLPVIADDSGIEVEALNNMPGIFSSRWAGVNCLDKDANVKLLLNQMSDIQSVNNRKARFACAIAFIANNKEIVVTATMNGSIAFKQLGNNGFSYDSVMIPDGYNHTCAQLSKFEKNKISHRRKAIDKLLPYIKDLF